MPHSMYQSMWAPLEEVYGYIQDQATDMSVQQNSTSSSDTQSSQSTDQFPTPVVPLVPHSLYESKWAPHLVDDDVATSHVACEDSHMEDASSDISQQVTHDESDQVDSSKNASSCLSHQVTSNRIDTVDSSETEEQTCPICQEPIEEPISTPCGHTFCKEDLACWLKDNSTCPYCRTQCTYCDVFGQPCPTTETPLQDDILTWHLLVDRLISPLPETSRIDWRFEPSRQLENRYTRLSDTFWALDRIPGLESRYTRLTNRIEQLLDNIEYDQTLLLQYRQSLLEARSRLNWEGAVQHRYRYRRIAENQYRVTESLRQLYAIDTWRAVSVEEIVQARYGELGV